jgi:preprotein translocase subunit SecA
LPDLATAMADIDVDTTMSDEQKEEKRRAAQAAFAERSERIHNVDQLIRAYCMYERDVEYVVQDNKVLIVDEFTGRVLPGRRWSDGLHQAVEAKEGVVIERETQTLATITIQNYFRMYDKLAGMTGTAETEASEFSETYGLDVLVIPTNRPVRRIDFHDQIFKTQREKYRAIIDDVVECHARRQPVLLGTISVDTSELLSRMLKRAKIPHNVLNAKQHEREAEVVTLAGQPGAVTIATNMAGRGTDIKLGEGVVYIDREIVTSSIPLEAKYDGSTLLKVLSANPCGLHVIGSERHEARRIDRQLRGRCARQGDPGSSRFYVSLEDDLMRLFASDRMAGVLSRLGLEEGQVLEHKWLNKSIETAQRRVEQHNFSIRKRTLEYDDVMNKQREVIYGFRGEIVRSDNVREHLYDIMWDVVSGSAEALIGSGGDEGITEFVQWVRATFPIPLKKQDIAGMADDAEKVGEYVFGKVKDAYELKIRTEDADVVNDMERHVIVRAIDTHWQDFLRSMDHLREGVHLRAYGQRDPLVEYKREAFDMFETLMVDIKDEIAVQVFRSSTSVEAFSRFMTSLRQDLVHDEVSLLGRGGHPQAASPDAGMPGGGVPQGGGPQRGGRPKGTPVHRDTPKVGRNDPCPCGSGKKYKKCCGM